MSSRYLAVAIHVTALILVVVNLTGCSDFIKGKKQEQQTIHLSDNRFHCLKVLPAHLKNFAVGLGQEEEVRGSVDCLRQSLIYFQEKTNGSIPGGYTMEEMRRFFGKYFLKENNVSAEFASDLMKIKRALLGGSDAYITKAEIIVLVDFLAVSRDQMVLLAPHVKVLLDQKKEQNDLWESIFPATDQLRKSLHVLLEKTQIGKSDYSFTDFKRALTGFADFVQGDQQTETFARYDEWLPFLEGVKNLLMGPRAQISTLWQWKEGLDSFINLYELVLQYHYVIRNQQAGNEIQLRRLTHFVMKVVDLLKNSHQIKTKGYISLSDIDKMIEITLPRMSSDIRPHSVMKAYRMFLIRILEPERADDTRGLVGLSLRHLKALEREINIWRLMQMFLDTSLRNKDGLTQKELFAALRGFDAKKVVPLSLVRDPLEQEALLSEWNDIEKLLMSEPLLAFDPTGRYFVGKHPQMWRHSWSSLTKLNLMRGLSRLLMLGYGSPSVDGKRLLSERGLVRWYDDFSELGQDLKAFDPRSVNSGSRSFMEASFFTYAGNGDGSLDFNETTQFISILFSSGLLSSSKASEEAIKARCEVEEKDVFGNSFFIEECFKHMLRTQADSILPNMPLMLDYLKGLSNQEWEEFYAHWRKASTVKDQRLGHIETGNIRVMITILHYIESIMLMYDTDGSGGLSLQEVQIAAPRFMPFFKKMKPDSYEMVLKQGFAYLVFEGQIPNASQLAGFQWSKMWGRLGEAKRLALIRLFANLKEQVSSPVAE